MGRLAHAHSASRMPGARSRIASMGTGRPGTGGVDEYQALQLLDEGVVKRGVSGRKMRSFPETPGPLLTRNKNTLR